jgi:hypothetical protein
MTYWDLICHLDAVIGMIIGGIFVRRGEFIRAFLSVGRRGRIERFFG